MTAMVVVLLSFVFGLHRQQVVKEKARMLTQKIKLVSWATDVTAAAVVALLFVFSCC